MNWFVNYWHAPNRETSFNLAVARVFVCVLAAWKVIAYPFAGVADYPKHLVATGAPGLWQQWPEFGYWIAVEQWIAGGCLVACAIGFAPGATSFTAAAMIAHLSAVVWPVCFEKTWLPTVYFLLLYGLFRHEDRYAVWPAPKAFSGLGVQHDRTDAAATGASLNSLKWFLVTIGAIYFFAGVHKLGDGGWYIQWASPTNMARMLEERSLCRGNDLPQFAAWMLNKPALLSALGLGTIVLELGLLTAVFTNRLLTPCFLGLAAMHLSIWAMMSVNYFTDLFAMYLVFVPWDNLFILANRPRAATPMLFAPLSEGMDDHIGAEDESAV